MQKLKCDDYPFYQFLNQQLTRFKLTTNDYNHPHIIFHQQLLSEINAFQKRIELLNQYIQKIGSELIAIKITGDGCGTYLKVKTPFFIDQHGILNLNQFVDHKDTYYYNNQRLIHKSIADLTDIPTTVKIRFGETPSRFKICNYYPFAQLLKLSGNQIEQLYPDSENYVEFAYCDFGIVSHY